jgi:hypothetical protein
MPDDDAVVLNAGGGIDLISLRGRVEARRGRGQ